MKTRTRGQCHTKGHYYICKDYIHLHIHMCHNAWHITKRARALLRGLRGLHTLASVRMCCNKSASAIGVERDEVLRVVSVVAQWVANMRPAAHLLSVIDSPTIEGFMWRCAAHVALCVQRALPECLETVR